MKYIVAYFVKQITHLNGVNHGWGNGYVVIPPEHPFYGKKYSDLFKVKDINTHQGAIDAFIPILILAINPDRKENEVSIETLVPVHGGITFSCSVKEILETWNELENLPIEEDWWVFGFDTAHYDDNQNNWNKERVLEETKKFAEYMQNIDDYILKE